jgi:hypothetical protein
MLVDAARLRQQGRLSDRLTMGFRAVEGERVVDAVPGR